MASEHITVRLSLRPWLKPAMIALFPLWALAGKTRPAVWLLDWLIRRAVVVEPANGKA